MLKPEFHSILFAGCVLLAACGEDNPMESVNHNPSVTVTANPSTVAPGQTSAITAVASDPDGDQLSYSYTATGGTVSGNGSMATFTAGNTPGSASVAVTVSDGRGGVGTASTALNIALSAPTMSVSAQEVPSTTPGLNCLVFTAVPSEDLVLNSVEITNPINQSLTYNLGGVLVLRGLPVDLQDSGSCYTKRSGVYRFVFTGTRPGGGPFTSTATYTQP